MDAMTTTLFRAALLLAALLCSLVAGFLFAFAAGVMPGIRSLDDGSVIRAFQTRRDSVRERISSRGGIDGTGSEPRARASYPFSYCFSSSECEDKRWWRTHGDSES
jgi:hypothetical protein